MPRKTVPIRAAVDSANHFLRESPDDQTRERAATANFLETLLHAADAYAGFGYLESAGVDYGRLHGGHSFVATDESRRVYFLRH